MFIPKKNRVATYSYLFKEGCLVVKKDPALPVHPNIEGVSNLEVMMLMKSLQSKGLVKITFSWQHYYCYLITESEEGNQTGLDYLRTYLALPAEIVPKTMKKTPAVRPGRENEIEKDDQGGRFRGDRDYRGKQGFGRGGGGF